MKKLFPLLLLLPLNLFSIIINENMGDVNNWYDSTDKFPFVVQRTTTDGTMFCSATLINPRTVLSAAHCAMNLPQQIWIGSDVSSSVTKVNVTSDVFFRFENNGIGNPATSTTGTDFSVLSLETPVYSVTEFPTIYSGGNFQDANGNNIEQEVYIVGYGTKGDNSGYEYGNVGVANLPDGKRRYVTNKVFNVPTTLGGFQKDYYQASFTNPNEASATTYEGTVAPGDSGGPIFLETISNGVASYQFLGAACCISLVNGVGGLYGTAAYWSDIRNFSQLNGLERVMPLKTSVSDRDGDWSSLNTWTYSGDAGTHDQFIPNNFYNVLSGLGLFVESARYYNVSISHAINLQAAAIAVDNLDINSSGSLSLDTNANLALSGNLMMDSDATIEIKINSSGDSGLINVNGTASLNGNLAIAPLTGGALYKKGLSYDFLNYITLNGNFSSTQIIDPSGHLGFLSINLSNDSKSFVLSNPNYQNLSNSHQTEAVSKILDNLESISSSNPSLYSNIQSILDEVNLSSSIASLNEQILYFAPDYNSTIGINTSNIIFLKNNIRFNPPKKSFNAFITKSDITQKNNLNAKSNQFIGSYSFEKFTAGFNVARSKLDVSSQDKIESSSFFLTSNEISRNKNLDFRLILSESNSDLERTRSISLNTSSSLQNFSIRSSFDSRILMIGVDVYPDESKRNENIFWKYINKIGFDVVNYAQDGFSETGHPRGLNLTTKDFSKTFFIASIEASLIKDLIVFNDSSVKFSSNVNYHLISSTGSIESYYDENLGLIRMNNQEVVEDQYGLEFQLKKEFSNSSIHFNFDLGNTQKNISLGYEITL